MCIIASGIFSFFKHNFLLASANPIFCHKQGGNQLFRLNTGAQLMQYDQCLYKDYSGLVKLTHCSTNEKAGWEYDPATKQLSYGEKKKDRQCLQLESKNGQGKSKFAPCDPSQPLQKFDFNKIEST